MVLSFEKVKRGASQLYYNVPIGISPPVMSSSCINSTQHKRFQGFFLSAACQDSLTKMKNQRILKENFYNMEAQKACSLALVQPLSVLFISFLFIQPTIISKIRR
ncbi:unnamed protein product [Ceratitis capitata]|uniref:(Mediterranean fruit fly) hypothetical protein n=1 Tax=Ceratitis capitata TaxID=7213 RepID=A0A811VGN6_CERCA|nr:unnamed protein product [Ceratitis capitata]